VLLANDALRSRGLTVLDVVNTVRASNLLLPSGTLRAGDRDYNVFSNTQIGAARPLRDVVVRPAGRGAGNDRVAPVRISDVAQVVDGTADQTEIARVNGSRGVYFRVQKQPGANTVDVVDQLRKTLPTLRGIPPSVKLTVSFDQSAYIRAAISSLEHEALWGSGLAILVILVFLASWSATGIIAVAIPVSIVATFVLLYFSGQTLNVFTLGGLALGVGRLVDDSIVELENIHRHLEMGGDRRSAVLAAAQEVAMPIFVSTITTIVVFFPVVFLTGVARNLFIPLALTIAFALMMSFFVSRTVTPILCLKYLDRGGHRMGEEGFARRITRQLNRMDEAYARSLRWVLRNRGKVIVSILVFFVASMALVTRVGTEFFPPSDESQIRINFKGPVGTRVERTEDVTKRIEQAIRDSLAPLKAEDGGPIASTVISTVGLPQGRGALFSGNTGPHAGQVQTYLVPHTRRSVTDEEAADKVRVALRDAIPGVQTYFFVGGIVKRILNFGAAAPIDIEIVGYDLEEGSAYAKRLLPRLRALATPDGRNLLTDLQVSREENYPQLDVVVDREKAGMLGVSEQQVAQTVLASLVGNTQFAPVPFTDPKTGNQYFINVRLSDDGRNEVADLKDVLVKASDGTVLPLANVNRKYLQRVVDLTANTGPGVDLGAASAAVERVLDEVPPPEGFSVQLSGQTQAQREAFGSLRFAALMALALVYMILASQFKSLLDPLVIMFSVPLGVSGVFIALWMTGTTLNVNSFMGIIMMVGIVVSNGVLLVDFARVLRERGSPLLEATVQAGKTRLRPILMTTIATIAGLMPMAMGIGEGSETNMPLARAVIGGLTVSTFFTLFLIPALYTLLARYEKPATGADGVDPDEGSPEAAT
jgi:multidrug efflux pump subunit AcrB